MEDANAIMLERLLHFVPDKTRSVDFLDLLTAIGFLKTSDLLMKAYEESPNEKIIEKWKSAIDAWVDRLMTLCSDPMPTKRWVGVHLLGLTCRKCSADRFLASYSGWFQKLHAQMQDPRKFILVKVASCASLAELLTRLGEFSALEEDGTDLAQKLIEPLLELLRGETPILEGQVRLLFAVLTSFPSAIHRYYDQIETAIASAVLSVKCSDGLSKKLAQCLAILPKSRGDVDSWSLLMQRILLSINDHLNDAFRGLEEGSMNDEVFRSLVPRGKQPPPPLGKEDAIVEGMEMPVEMTMTRLMLCCHEMFEYSLPVQVNLPVRSLLTLIERILKVCESMARNLSSVTAAQEELILILLTFGLEMLDVLIKVLHSQILPHAPCIVRLISRYFKNCTLPELRRKVYSVIAILLISRGMGIAIYLGQEVVNSASMDLNGDLVSKDHRRVPSDVKIAALKALNFLATASLKSESWRSEVDTLLISVATNVMDERGLNEGNWSCLPDEPASVRGELQLAALDALLASLLSRRDDPPHLAKSLLLFQRGKQQMNTEIVGFCHRAVQSIRRRWGPSFH